MATESCGIYTRNSVWWIEGKSFYGGTTWRSPTDTSRKFLRALDIETGKVVLEVPGIGRGATGSGVMSTEGGPLFFSDDNGGAFVAADARTGELLWHFNTGENWKADPRTYAIDGKQYIAMAGGSTVMVFALP